MSRTPWRSSAPFSTSAIAALSAVCPPSVGKSASGLFAHEDFFNRLGSDRLDVGAMRELRIRHDGGRIRVDENDFVSFFGEGLASLDARNSQIRTPAR